MPPDPEATPRNFDIKYVEPFISMAPTWKNLCKILRVQENKEAFEYYQMDYKIIDQKWKINKNIEGYIEVPMSNGFLNKKISTAQRKYNTFNKNEETYKMIPISVIEPFENAGKRPIKCKTNKRPRITKDSAQLFQEKKMKSKLLTFIKMKKKERLRSRAFENKLDFLRDSFPGCDKRLDSHHIWWRRDAVVGDSSPFPPPRTWPTSGESRNKRNQSRGAPFPSPKVSILISVSTNNQTTKGLRNSATLLRPSSFSGIWFS